MSKYSKDKRIRIQRNVKIRKFNIRMLISLICILFAIAICMTTNRVMIQGMKSINLSDILNTCTVTIEYLSADGTNTLYTSYEATLPIGTNFSESVVSPSLTGYTPYIIDEDGEYDYESDGVYYDDATVVYIDIEDLQEDVTIYVYYMPNEVTYKINRYTQNVYDENYTLYSTEVKTGTVDTEIDEDEINTEIEGFTQLIYEESTVAADGSTEVNVFYDRDYYLITFDLLGGYGVDPIYAKYGSTVRVTGTPTRTGYEFVGWDLDGDGIEDSVVTTMPAENLTYTAIYAALETTYTVAYWLEDADSDDYEFWGSETITAYSGTNATVESTAEELGLTDYFYTTYNYADTDNSTIEVEGDGTTVVNVYYDRNEYTLMFFYAKELNGSYYVASATTSFGSAYSGTDYEQEDLLDNVSSWGQVTALPTLSSEYSSQSEISTGSITSSSTGSTYYYLKFTAKFGQTISDLWPVDVLGDVTTTSNSKDAYLASWNGEKKLKYTQDNASGNQTIKGLYTKLDESLLYDYDTFGEDSETVSFLGYWSGGTWSTAVEWQYSIYVEELNDSGDGLTGSYELLYSYSLYLTSTTLDGQTAVAIDGYTYSYRDGGATGNKNSDGLYIYTADFYYTRDTNTVTLSNAGTETDAGDYYYGQSLAELNEEPDYPSNYEEDVYEFDGWYTTASCIEGTEFDFDNDTMPAHDLVLYAKWTKISHTITLYATYSDYLAGENPYAYLTVEHGSSYGEDYEITRDGYDFIGWFYFNEDGEKQIFSLNSMQVNEDLELYAEWQGLPLIEYEIYYVYIDSDGNEIQIADTTTGSWYNGSTKVFSAKTGSSLYEEYQEYFFPTLSSHCVLIETDDDDGVVTYTFYYVHTDSVKYTVQYLDYDTGEELYESKTVYTTSAIVTETFVAIEGYLPISYQISLIIVADDSSENVITFYYQADVENGIFLVSHYIETLDGEWQEVATEEGTAVLGTTLSRTANSYTGYTYNSEISTASGTITTDGLHLKLYYNLNEYSYTIQYLEYGTNEELQESETGTAKYTSTITAEALEIDGYELISSSPKSITINAPTSDDDSTTNIITFYYIEVETATITITKVDQDDTDETLEGVEFSLYKLICTDADHEHDTDDDLIDVDDYDESCWELVDTYITDENGEFTLEKLSLSYEYRLVETKTVGSYLVPSGQWKIEFDQGDLEYDSGAITYNDTLLKISAVGNPPALSLLESEDDESDILYLYNSTIFDIPTSGGEGLEYFCTIGIPVAAMGVCSVYVREKMLAGVVVHRSIRRSRRRR